MTELEMLSLLGAAEKEKSLVYELFVDSNRPVGNVIDQCTLKSFSRARRIDPPFRALGVLAILNQRRNTPKMRHHIHIHGFDLEQRSGTTPNPPSNEYAPADDF